MDRDKKSLYKNHHFNENIYNDCIRLLKRIQTFAQKGSILPTDEMNMKYFHWTKDHLNRCYQMMKAAGVLTYSRNNRRTTLRFLGDCEYLNKFILKEKKR